MLSSCSQTITALALPDTRVSVQERSPGPGGGHDPAYVWLGDEIADLPTSRKKKRRNLTVTVRLILNEYRTNVTLFQTKLNKYQFASWSKQLSISPNASVGFSVQLQTINADFFFKTDSFTQLAMSAKHNFPTIFSFVLYMYISIEMHLYIFH